MLASLCFQGAIEALTFLSPSELCLIRVARFPPTTVVHGCVCAGGPTLILSYHCNAKKNLVERRQDQY